MESGEYRLGRLRPEVCGGLIIVYAVRRNPAKGRATNGIFLLCSKCLWMPSPVALWSKVDLLHTHGNSMALTLILCLRFDIGLCARKPWVFTDR